MLLRSSFYEEIFESVGIVDSRYFNPMFLLKEDLKNFLSHQHLKVTKKIPIFALATYYQRFKRSLSYTNLLSVTAQEKNVRLGKTSFSKHPELLVLYNSKVNIYRQLNSMLYFSLLQEKISWKTLNLFKIIIGDSASIALINVNFPSLEHLYELFFPSISVVNMKKKKS